MTHWYTSYPVQARRQDMDHTGPDMKHYLDFTSDWGQWTAEAGAEVCRFRLNFIQALNERC